MTLSEQKVWEGWLAAPEKLEKTLREKANVAPGVEQRERTRARQKLRRLQTAMMRLGDDYPQLYRGEMDLSLSEKQMDELISKVCGESGGYEQRDIQRYLVTGLARGVGELGWQMPVPAPMVTVAMETSNMSPDMFGRLGEFDALNGAYLRHLESGHVDNNAGMLDDAGELIFSIVLHSGVCSKGWLKLVPDAIRQGVGTGEGMVWLELGTENNLENTDYADRRRRLFLAPVTQLLLLRWYKRWGKSWPRDVESGKHRPVDFLLRRFARTLCQNEGIAPQIAEHCSRLSEANLATQVPHCVLHYMRSNRVGVPVPEQNWLRLVSDCRVDVKDDERAVTVTPRPIRSGKLRTAHKFPDQQRLFVELRRSVESLTSRAFSEFVNAFVEKDEVSPILHCLACWAQFLSEHGGTVKKRLEKSSIARYLNWVKPLIYYAEDVIDPLHLDEDSWQAIYDEIIANAHGRVSDSAGRLAEFHQFMVDVYGAPTVDIAGMSQGRQVDARLLTPREFQRVKQVLRRSGDDEALVECRILILILGYRLGLRRGEAYSRLLSDFSGFDIEGLENVELLIRPNKNARIKSATSTRRLPLHVLLTSEELQALKSFYQRRRALIIGSGKAKPIFKDVAGNHWPAIISNLFDPITEALKSVTGDNHFRFHHLRHSFVSITYLRLMETSPCQFFPAMWREDESGRALLPHADAVFGRVAKLPDTGQALWLLAMWAGHASPQVTLECYLHLLDWLVGQYLVMRHNPDLSIQAQQVLLDKSEGALERYRNRIGFTRAPTPAGEIAKAVCVNWPVKGRREVPKMRPHDCSQAQTAPPSKKTNWLDPYNLQFWAVQPIMNAGVEEPRGLEAAAELVGIAMDVAQRWDRTSKAIMSLTTNRDRAPHNQSPLIAKNPRPKLSRGTDDVRRSLADKDPSKRLPEIPGRFLSPPNTPTTRDFAERYFEGLIEWFERDPERAALSMKAALESSQRSKPEIKPRGAARQRLFYDLLRELGLASRVKLAIKISEKTNKQKVKKYWAAYFNVSPKQIVCKPETLPKKLGLNGRCHISVAAPDALHKNQNLFWATFRFALLSAYVVCVDEDW